MMVDRWFDPEWQEAHNQGRERRAMMQGPSHHQGSLSLDAWKAKWSNAHGGEQITNFQAYAMGHQTKYSTAARYDPAAPASSYSNPSVHARLTQYIETAKEVYGPEYDPATHDIDGEVVMRAEEERFVAGT
ncbi:uncharacterized protein LOC110437462 [Sorghum bicolor]|uniref:uncharacterized protein LOC110437462 n=1 Tax=Sorghum bicolor TaxID=4558 RepID=UPI000B4237AD|nr:uncharacterized protein LOC110437462 [Sorghum bicolor]|eukprot:XP_021321590.1 uncharacterized protein LOC110437462 [Sorghum bicolor]